MLLFVLPLLLSSMLGPPARPLVGAFPLLAAGTRAVTVVALSTTVAPADITGSPRRAAGDTLVAGDTLTAALASITTDTGDLVRGHTDFSRYTTPELCLAAAQSTLDDFTHSLDAQLRRTTFEHYGTDGDTVGLSATAPVVRACGERFTLANTTLRQAYTLFELALYERNPTLAQQALARWVAAMADSTPEQRAARMYTGVRPYFQFGYPALGLALLAQIDALHLPVSCVRAGWEFDLMKTYQNAGDLTRAQQANARLLALTEQRPQHDPLCIYNVLSALASPLRQAITAGVGPDSVRAVAQQLQPVLKRTGWGDLSLDSVVTLLAPEWYTAWLAHRGHGRAARLEADYWFPAPDQVGDTAAGGKPVIPAPGRVNLICMGGYPRDDEQSVFISGSSLGTGYGQARILQRWLAEYGARGLMITLVRPVTELNNIELEVGKGGRNWMVAAALPASAAAAARAWRWYDQVYHQLPVTLAMQPQATTRWLPAPDGRRLEVAQIQYQQYVDSLTPDFQHGVRAQADPGSCTVIDRDGALLGSDASPGWSYANVDGLLRWLFRSLDTDGASRQSKTVPAAQTNAAPSGLPASPGSPDELHPSLRGGNPISH